MTRLTKRITLYCFFILICCISIYIIVPSMSTALIISKDIEDLKLVKHNFDKQQALKKAYKLENHTRFLYSLTIKDLKPENEFDLEDTYIVPFSNPYEKTFNDLEFMDFKIAKNYTAIENNTNADLVVFKLKDGIDESIYIPKNESIYIKLKQLDTLLFYYGTNFTNNTFPSFKKNTGISNLYEINNLNTEMANKITVNAFKSTNINSAKAFKSEKFESIIFKNISAKELVHIKYIYSNYYKKKYKS